MYSKVKEWGVVFETVPVPSMLDMGYKTLFTTKVIISKPRTIEMPESTVNLLNKWWYIATVT